MQYFCLFAIGLYFTPLRLGYMLQKSVPLQPNKWHMALLKHFLWILIFSLFSLLTTAQNLNVSSAAQISLLTCAPGNELYSTFGHSAIRINDTLTGVDVVYNYGIFDFDTPNFYWLFVQGKLLYKLEAERTRYFIREYRTDNRRVIEQQLNLTDTQKTQILAFLSHNNLPENKYYSYDFFYNNCSTKIRDIFNSELKDSLQIHPAHASTKTFRQMLAEYLVPLPWAHFGIDLILGLPTDQIANYQNEMFLPDYLAQNLSQGYMIGSQSVVSATETTLVDVPRNSMEPPLWQKPIFVFSLLLLFTLLLTFFVRIKWLKTTFDVLFFGILAFCGLIFVFMGLFTNHQATHYNLNMLWANPLYFLLPVLGRANIWKGIGLLALLLLLLFPVFPQGFNVAFIPIFLCIAIRAADRGGII